MAGELNGTGVFLQMLINSVYTLVGGQLSHSQSLSTSLIELTNKSSGEHPRYLSRAGAISESFSIELLFSSDAAFFAMRDAYALRTVESFKLIKPNLPEEPFDAIISSFVETSPNSNALTASMTIQVGNDSTAAIVLSSKVFGGASAEAAAVLGGDSGVGDGSGGAGSTSGGAGSFWFRTSVSFNDSIDFWTLDETSGDKAANIGKGLLGFTKEPLLYNPVAIGSSLSSISSKTGVAKDLAGLAVRTIHGQTFQSGSVFARSATWGIEFALDLNVTAVDDIVLSFWDADSVATAGKDMLIKIAVDSVDSDVLNLILYTTDDDVGFTLRTNIIVPSIAALQTGYSYFSIFFISKTTLICRVENVETLNVDISSWEARLSSVSTTAKFRVGAEKNSPTLNIMDGKIDEISTYASVSGLNFDTTRTYEWWSSVTGPSSGPTPPAAPTSFVEAVTNAAPNLWFRLDEISGAVAADSGSAGLPATYSQAVEIAGNDVAPSTAFTGGRAKDFQANGLYATQDATNSNPDSIPDLTVEFAWKPKTVGFSTDRILSFEESAGTFVKIEIDRSGTAIRFKWFYDTGSFTSSRTISAFSPIVAGEWHYVSITYDDANSLLTMRVNNVQFATFSTIGRKPIGTFETSNNAAIFVIGNDTDLVTPSTSMIDELQIYYKVLTVAEMDDNYNFWATGTNVAPPAWPPVITVTNYVESVTTKGPIHWWTLDETTGLVATDDGSRAKNLNYNLDASLTDVAPLSTRAKVGNRAKTFFAQGHRVGDIINKDVGYLTPSIGWTIEFVMKHNGTGITNGSIFEYGIFDGAGQAQYELRINNDLSIQMKIFDNAGASTFFTVTDTVNNNVNSLYPPPINMETHIQLSYDPILKTVSPRVNGAFQNSVDISSRPMNTNPETLPAGVFGIGGDPFNGNGGCNAILSEIRIYDKTLTDSQMAENYIYWYDGTGPSGGDILNALDGSTLSQQSFDASLLVSSAASKEWIIIDMDSASLGSYVGKVNLETGLNVHVEIYEKQSGGAWRLARAENVSAPFNLTGGLAALANPGYDLSILCYNNSGSAQDIQIRVPSV